MTTATTTKNKRDAIGDLVRDIVQAYTREHEKIRVTVDGMQGLKLIGLRVSQADHGKVVGSQGKHITALQNIVAKLKPETCKLILEDPEDRTPAPKSSPVQASPDWDARPLVDLLVRTMKAMGHKPKVKPTKLSGYVVLLVGCVPPLDKLTTESLATIWHAMGRCEGQDVRVEFAPAP